MRFSLEVCSEYSVQFMVIIFLQSLYGTKVPCVTITFAPVQKISYKTARGVFLKHKEST